jgi:hypothetical protein
MAPPITKTWQFNINQNITLGVNSCRTMLLAIKNSLLGFASNPWTVEYSCNSVTAGAAGDGIDRWVTGSNLVYVSAAGTAHSWIVLKQAGLASNLQIVIDLVTSGAGASAFAYANIFISGSAGFTGGSTTDRPTATDEYELTQHENWVFQDNTKNYILHVMQSTDGQCTRIFCMNNGYVAGVWFIEKLQNPRPGIALPYAASVMGSQDGTSDASSIHNFTDFISLVARFGAINTGAALTGEGAFATLISNHQKFADDIDGSYWLSPIGVNCYTAGAKGRYGTLFDVWWGSPSAVNGDTYDETTNTLVSMGQFIVPSNAAKWQIR